MQLPHFNFDNTYARDLVGTYIFCSPDKVPAPELLFFNLALAEELNLNYQEVDHQKLAACFAGNHSFAGAQPLAQAYAGHQFGNFSAQLGDGRALIIGEVLDRFTKRRDLAFKGSGPTPFSRGGDGKAAIGPMLREALMGEAMHALGIPTTRALAVVASGEPIHRNRILAGAILTRVASSHIRVGTFEFFAARAQMGQVQSLLDYAIARHNPSLISQSTPQRYKEWLSITIDRQASLIAQWMNVGFIHGVMNTDNMTIAGETLDYGPCAFIEAYDPQQVFSSIDQQARYAYGNQPQIAQWNLARLAEAILPLLSTHPTEAINIANELVDSFTTSYQRYLLQGQRAKLGLQASYEEDPVLVQDWLNLLKQEKIDFTLAWRYLGDAAGGQPTRLKELFQPNAHPALDAWLSRWENRCQKEDQPLRQQQQPLIERSSAMAKLNPLVIPRNHRVEEALSAATNSGDIEPFNRLLASLRCPFTEQPDSQIYAQPATQDFTKSYQTFCGT